MNEFIGKKNGKTIKFLYDDVSKQIYISRLISLINGEWAEDGILKCNSYEKFKGLIFKLKTDNKDLQIIEDLE